MSSCRPRALWTTPCWSASRVPPMPGGRACVSSCHLGACWATPCWSASTADAMYRRLRPTLLVVFQDQYVILAAPHWHSVIVSVGSAGRESRFAFHGCVCSGPGSLSEAPWGLCLSCALSRPGVTGGGFRGPKGPVQPKVWHAVAAIGWCIGRSAGRIGCGGPPYGYLNRSFYHSQETCVALP